jgi:hypothetical protein
MSPLTRQHLTTATGYAKHTHATCPLVLWYPTDGQAAQAEQYSYWPFVVQSVCQHSRRRLFDGTRKQYSIPIRRVPYQAVCRS